MQEEISLSVRPLVEYVFRSGSIETGFRSATAMTEGTKIHQKIQKSYKETDQKEVFLRTELTLEEIMIKLEGRCDGLLIENDEIIIDEIKSTKKDLNGITEDTYPVHWAQAQCYAYMYAKYHHSAHMIVQLTYVHVLTEEKAVFRKRLSFDELETFINFVIKEYLPYANLRLRHMAKRDSSIQSLKFPYSSYRKGQRHFAGAVYKTISEQKNLFANAPTGIGKTISATFPSIKAMGEGKLKRIIYLTAKTITRQVAEEAFFLMLQKGLTVHSVTITAKEKVCFKENLSCSKESCDFSNGYYDRINGAILDILSNETIMNRKVIEQYAFKHKVCPFEFSLDLAYTADVIICDYNYIFDPKVSLRRLVEEQKKETVLLVDEAHNLVERARNMFSSQLVKSEFLHIKREFKSINKSLSEAAKKLNDFFIAVKKQIPLSGFIVEKNIPEELLVLVDEFTGHAEAELLSSRTEPDELLLEAFFSAGDFLRIAKLFDERFVYFCEKDRNEIRISLLCLDPSMQLQKTGKGYRSKVYFSATLQPIHFFKDMLGADQTDYTISIPTPFTAEQTEIFIYPLSTRYHDRERSLVPISDYIYEQVNGKPGNYLIFFPSYKYMQDVLSIFMQKEFSGKISIQNSDMTEQEREDFLESFTENAADSHAGFAVLGGIFSEGVDLKGDRLSGVVVVGVGLPQLNAERNIMKDYFTSTGKNGYDYAYVFPGMNKILQAGGRLIRSESDTGTIVLIDDRYLTPKYQSMLPEEWRNYKIVRRQ
ncbi:Rad3-related DNA helicase [Peribacillus deserti]|uniref:Rad3-related DNA helicase n=1 Tax=Peribacillus deserti TaxID=673318 RepID=A0ABS2QKX6_9BACI|nr:ATP-dependent DNA helicase [Peribacillus deserti]MBM7693419.1 Rad3-related DNA helicase [Peribacillus deserti]